MLQNQMGIQMLVRTMARTLILLALLRPCVPLRLPRVSVVVGRRVALAHLVLPAGMVLPAGRAFLWHAFAGDTEGECIGVFKERALVSETDAVVSVCATSRPNRRQLTQRQPSRCSSTPARPSQRPRATCQGLALPARGCRDPRRAAARGAAGSVVYRALAAASPPVDPRKKRRRDGRHAPRRAQLPPKASVAVAALRRGGPRDRRSAALRGRPSRRPPT